MHAFFHHNVEELRTAKISTLVVALAFVCWTPFFAVCAATNSFTLTVATAAGNTTASAPSASPSSSTVDMAVFYLHCASNLLALAFAGVSPYVYVFRSDKVRRCPIDSTSKNNVATKVNPNG